jgi:hypothetical protein
LEFHLESTSTHSSRILQFLTGSYVTIPGSDPTNPNAPPKLPYGRGNPPPTGLIVAVGCIIALVLLVKFGGFGTNTKEEKETKTVVHKEK